METLFSLAYTLSGQPSVFIMRSEQQDGHLHCLGDSDVIPFTFCDGNYPPYATCQQRNKRSLFLWTSQYCDGISHPGLDINKMKKIHKLPLILLGFTSNLVFQIWTQFMCTHVSVHTYTKHYKMFFIFLVIPIEFMTLFIAEWNMIKYLQDWGEFCKYSQTFSKPPNSHAYLI